MHTHLQLTNTLADKLSGNAFKKEKKKKRKTKYKFEDNKYFTSDKY